LREDIQDHPHNYGHCTFDDLAEDSFWKIRPRLLAGELIAGCASSRGGVHRPQGGRLLHIGANGDWGGNAEAQGSAKEIYPLSGTPCPV
jgi:hypothetical protein